ncbi:MAG: LytTR family DNA-binding domain-containing protein [Cytophagales bacterium]|nr:LytTR family DNA-binding domain-containing protein [Cytophagales bacterium]
MNILILDDELPARASIKSYLKRCMKLKYVVFEASDISEASEITKEFQIDLAFLDIKLKQGTSFDFLAHLEMINFKIIFVSGYDEYAIKAFRFNAVDYILKPIELKEFEQALQKALDLPPINDQQIANLTSDIQSKMIKRIVLKDIHSIFFIEIQDIIYCQSENNYTTFFIKDRSEITVSKTLKCYENILRPLGFFRIHRSFLINLKLAIAFDKREGGSIQMINGAKIPLARNKKELFMQFMQNQFNEF